MVKYRITSLLVIGDGQALLKAIFPAFDGEQACLILSSFRFFSTRAKINSQPSICFRVESKFLNSATFPLRGIDNWVYGINPLA